MLDTNAEQINSDIIRNEKVLDDNKKSINIFSDVLYEIESGLSDLRILTLNTDFSKTTERQNYYNNITNLKHFYERAERIIVNDNCK